MPWIGKRTNRLDGPHVALLSQIENPVGIKIGADSDETHIAGLQACLNPQNRAGKLIFMLRMGMHEDEGLDRILSAIGTHAPNALVMFDVHGTTRMNEGRKIRCVPDIVANIKATAAACRKAGLKLHGLHLETTMEENRRECTDTPDDLPEHDSCIDPLLSPQQTERILRETATDLL
jgi:3-deoxy-7-phosphoheptulonate synthase